MSKKLIAGLLVLAIVATTVWAQQEARPQNRRGPQGGQQGGGQGASQAQQMRGRMQTWLQDLEDANEQKDHEKVGKLISEMKERMASFSSGSRPTGQGQNQDRAGQGSSQRSGSGSAQRGPGGTQRPGSGDSQRSGRSQGGPGQNRPGQGGPSQRQGDETFMPTSAVPKNSTERKVLSVLEDMRRTPEMRAANVPTDDGRLLRLLVEAIDAKHVVEIGTSTGVSGTWMGLALKNTGGKLTTHEIDPSRAKTAMANFKRAGVDKQITIVEGDAHQTVAKIKGPIDLLFLDADKEGYIDYLDKLMPLVRPGGLIVAHNMNPRQADANFIDAITTDPDLETLLLHKEGTGVSVTLKKR
ncbi:MAG: O-methyltransferase [Planctomycetes bacterium]|nr:O-methyltransferase [Planctomycetota bacterium]